MTTTNISKQNNGKVDYWFNLIGAFMLSVLILLAIILVGLLIMIVGQMVMSAIMWRPSIMTQRCILGFIIWSLVATPICYKYKTPIEKLLRLY